MLESYDDAYARLAELAEVADPMLEITRIPQPGMWDVNGLVLGKITGLAVDAASRSLLDTGIDAQGNLVRTVEIIDYRKSKPDRLQTGQLSLTYQDGTFDGIRVDLTASNKGSYHLAPNGQLSREKDGAMVPVGRLRGRLLFTVLSGYEPDLPL